MPAFPPSITTGCPREGGYHWPPPELVPGFPHRLCTSSQLHSGVPVAAFSAHKIPLPPPRYSPTVGLTGTVATYTVPWSYPGIMSMPSWSLPISVRIHNCRPVAADRANAAWLVVAYTTPLATLTPSGPPLGEL